MGKLWNMNSDNLETKQVLQKISKSFLNATKTHSLDSHSPLGSTQTISSDYFISPGVWKFEDTRNFGKKTLLRKIWNSLRLVSLCKADTR